MSISRLKNKFLFAGKNRQLKFVSWTTYLKEFGFGKYFGKWGSNYKPLSFIERDQSYNKLKEQFKFSRNSFKFYHRFYYNSTTKKVINIVFKRFPTSRPFCTFAAAAYSFSWEDNGISNDEILNHVEELKMLELQSPHEDELPKQSEYTNLPTQWENILDEPHIKIWRMPFRKGCMQYKVFGRFSDITANQFFTVQTNLEYRRKWDELVVDIQVIDKNVSTDEQVLHWITHFPYPFNPREYVFIRRAKVLPEEKIFVLFNRSVDHPDCVPNKKYVRVPIYKSDMVIKSHKSLDEPGMDFLLTYFDNPQITLPNKVSSLVFSSSIPNYIEKLHQASLQADTYMDRSFIYSLSGTNDVAMQPLRCRPRTEVLGAF